MSETRLWSCIRLVGGGSRQSWRQCGGVGSRPLLELNHNLPTNFSGGRRFLSNSVSGAGSELPSFDAKKALTYTQPPSPESRFGQDVPRPMRTPIGRKRWDSDTTLPGDIYRLLGSAIIPRPIAFVSTLSNDGAPNLVSFSYFSVVSQNPPMISLSCISSEWGSTDSRENILSTKEFTVNLLSEIFAEAANATAVECSTCRDGWSLSGLTSELSTTVRPPLVREGSVGMECELYSFQDICAPNSSEITATVVLAIIKRMHIRESVLDESGEIVDPAKLRPLARIGDESYSRLTEAFDLPRVSWRTVGGSYNGLLG